MDRYAIVAELLQEQERSDMAYLRGELDRDTWSQNLRSVDERLAVIGLRLASRPGTMQEAASATMAKTGF